MLSTSTAILVQGWSETGSRQELHIDEWRALLARHAFGLTNEGPKPSSGQLWGQLIRTYFGDPTKTFPNEAEWETGVRLGYLLGLSPEVLSQAGEVGRLEKQRKAVRAAVREGPKAPDS